MRYRAQRPKGISDVESHVYKKTTEHQTIERGEEKPVDTDDYIIRRKNRNEKMEDVYNHIHF